MRSTNIWQRPNSRDREATAMRPSSMFWPGLAIAAGATVLDQASKWWIVEVVMQPPQKIEITSFFNLVMGWNRGVSFGLFNSGSQLNAWLLPLIALVILVVMVFWLCRVQRPMVGVAIGFIIGGALGNLIDRGRFGAVADFLQLHLERYGCPFGTSYCYWPAFNLADTMITVGAAMILVDALFDRRKTD
jgi:signal peptidase II